MFLQKRFFNFLVCVLMGILIFTVVSCRQPWQVHPERVAPKVPDRMIDLYDQAMLAYRDGSYIEAAELFNKIRQQTDDGKTARMALYGLACSSIMAAETPEAYYLALLLWRSWAQNAPAHTEHENPLLFKPVIDKKMLFSRIPLGQDESDKVEDDTVPVWVHIKVKREMEALEKKVTNTEHTLQQQNKMIESQEKEISKLKQQIKALETIDQKIQKKKNAIPSTD
jgi:TolA-binding protein